MILAPKIFLDNCCLSRPYDNHNQTRLRLESDAVVSIIERIERKAVVWIGSNILRAEIEASSNVYRRSTILDIYDALCDSRSVVLDAITKSREFLKFGLGPIDAVHLYFAELHGCDFLLTTDDRFVKRAKRCKDQVKLRVQNPVEWLQQNALP